MLVLDTDAMTFLELESAPERDRVLERLDRTGSPIVTTIVNYEEQTRGWLAFSAKASSVASQIRAYSKLKRHLILYRNAVVLDFDEFAAVEFQKLRQSRMRIGSADLKIAAIGLANDATSLTRNLSDFRKVPGLKVEDWSAA